MEHITYTEAIRDLITTIDPFSAFLGVCAGLLLAWFLIMVTSLLNYIVNLFKNKHNDKN